MGRDAQRTGRGLRRAWPAAILGIAAIAAIAWLVLGRGGRTIPLDVAGAAAPRGGQDREGIAVAAPTPRQAVPPGAAPPASAPNAPAGEEFSGDLTPEQSQEIAQAWSAVDMEEVRKAMPDNLYWKLSVPTQDPQVLEERDAERKRWNVEYGKVLSGTGTDEEIRAYYDLRARLAGDYIEFASYLLDHYALPERDVGLLQLAIRLQRARLEAIPRKVEEAMDRKRQQDAAREAWLADQQIFGDANPNAGPVDQSNSDQ